MKSGTDFSPIYTFSLAGNLNVYRPNQGSNREIYFTRKNL